MTRCEVSLVVIFGVTIAACSKGKSEDGTALAPAASAATPAVPSCEQALAGAYAKAEIAEAASMAKALGAPCRRRLMEDLCTSPVPCADNHADALVEATADGAERKALLGIQLPVRAKTVERAEALFRETQQVGEHALAIRNGRRSVTPECMNRFRADMAKINALKARYVEEATPTVFDAQGVLNLSLGCLDCSDNRTPCDEISYALKSTRESLAEARDELAKVSGEAGIVLPVVASAPKPEAVVPGPAPSARSNVGRLR